MKELKDMTGQEALAELLVLVNTTDEAMKAEARERLKQIQKRFIAGWNIQRRGVLPTNRFGENISSYDLNNSPGLNRR